MKSIEQNVLLHFGIRKKHLNLPEFRPVKQVIMYLCLRAGTTPSNVSKKYSEKVNAVKHLHSKYYDNRKFRDQVNSAKYSFRVSVESPESESK